MAKSRKTVGVGGVELYDYGNIGNEPVEKASDPMNIGIQKNLIYFSRMKAQIINL